MERDRASDQPAKKGIDVEIIDVRTLKPLEIDLLAESVGKSFHAVVVHEACLTAGFGAEISARIGEELFDYPGAPVPRIGAKDAPILVSAALENYILPQTEDIVEGVKKGLNR
jgi:pyruvate/2-oxoglutarate/acetoin dehydrogenase E1 component